MSLRTTKILFGCFAGLTTLLICSRMNPALEARLDLLMQGYVFVRLVEPMKVNPMPPHQGMVWRFVYHDGNYEGFINPYGYFLRPASRKGWEAQIHSGGRRMVLAVIFLFTSAATTLLLLIRLVVDLIRSKKRSRSGQRQALLER